ncbi:hypothetical protein HNP84_000473 [Thermocatellispora tengchongensis]|uniref:Uncharacterized protein n=1 Tax=Thermocatellispora tengchongensis TaxID=1073253 RepID=A0A840P416_9ACTN|nr:hypothetical protein [Thermocatellispora tengchongensis]MBB5130785.1 hypothetical protein [Thermocatellispora tengchongensis]
MDGSLSPLRLPYDALRLAAGFFLPLAFFYALAVLAHDAVILLAVYVAEPTGWRAYAGFGVLSFAVLFTLMGYIAMLNTLGRRELVTETSVLTLDERERRLVEALSHTLLPFLIFYGAWGLFTDDVRRFYSLSVELGPLQEKDVVAEAETLLRLFDINILIVVLTLVIFLLKVAVERLYAARPLKVLGVATSSLECLWMFYGIISIGNWLGEIPGWLSTRAAWQAALGLIPAQVTEAWQAITPYLPDPKDGLVLPLLWLAITAVVYSSDVTRDEKVIEGTKVEGRVSGLWNKLPAHLQTATEFLSRGIRDKYVPLLNGLRFALGSGAVFCLTFCALYVALDALADLAFLGVTRLIGPHEILWWQMWNGAAGLPVALVFEVLRVCLLAAAFDLALQRIAVRRGSTGSAEPAPAPTSTPAPQAQET